MARIPRIPTLALGLLLGFAGAAQAGDLCLDLGGVIYVGKGAGIPPKGSCKTWKGIAPGLCGTGGTSTGTICRNTAQNRVDVEIVTSCPGGLGFVVDHATLPYPSLTGGTEDFYVPDVGLGGVTNSFSANKVTCSPTTVPIPADNPKLRALARN